MIGLNCDTARLLLQAPNELQHEARALDAHLADCAACRAFNDRQRSMDALITRSLDSLTEGRTVHASVRARLQREAHAKQPRARRSPWRALRLGVPLALIAAVLAVAFPQFATHLRETQTSAQSFPTKHIDVGYPLAIDPEHPDHLLAGALGRVYQSWNGGKSWKYLAPLPGAYVIRQLAIDRSDPRRFVVAAKYSVIVSNDAGHHWTVAKAGLPGAMNMFLVQDRVNPATFYVGPSVLWKSTDHGLNWAPAGPGTVFAPYGIQALASTRNGTLFTGIWSGGVAMSHNGGRTWQSRSSGLFSKVFDVEIGAGLWAATTHGVYSSHDNGLHWKRTTPNDHFLVTTILANGNRVFAGGHGALYRTLDAGKHWRLAMDGLPPDPYVYGLAADPSNPNRLYVSLDSDGIFRSDDGGLTWTAASAGLPLNVTEGNARHILFLRNHVLWYTSTNGADPGNLTVDEDVRTAALSPDDGTAVYTVGSSSDWAVRMVAMSSTAQTLIQGTSDMPGRLLWTADSARLAAISTNTVYVSTLKGHVWSWLLTAHQRVLGWGANDHALWVWDSSTHLLTQRQWNNGVAITSPIGPYAAAPRIAPDGTHIAMLIGGKIDMGTVKGPVHQVASAGPTCLLGSWSDDAQRVMVRCGTQIELVAPTGVTARALARGHVLWLPGSHTSLLYFHHGSLWKWSHGSVHRLVSSAHSLS
jgi:photosystem II stability/assembly factor-like uncharacterized protein